MSISLLLLVPAASAGGIGLFGTAGVHAEKVYYYSNEDEDGNPFRNVRDYEQFIDVQTLLNYGAGVEFALGDKDDLIQGSARFYYMQDAAQKDPSADTLSPEAAVVEYRDTVRHVGVGLIGMNWGIVDVADKRLRLNVVGHLGSGFLTIDHTEFLIGSVGPGVAVKAARQVFVHADLLAQVRSRKGFSPAPCFAVGTRYYFD